MDILKYPDRYKEKCPWHKKKKADYYCRTICPGKLVPGGAWDGCYINQQGNLISRTPKKVRAKFRQLEVWI